MRTKYFPQSQTHKMKVPTQGDTMEMVTKGIEAWQGGDMDEERERE